MDAVYADIPEELRRLIEPVVEDCELELVDVELRRGRPPFALRVIVDTPAGDGRVSIDRCVQVSRELSPRLDLAEPIEGRYTLEVSSPGFDRVLAREKDFAGACGREVKLELRRPLEGRKRFRGRLHAFANGVLTLEVDGETVALPFADVARAHAVHQFSREDFVRA